MDVSCAIFTREEIVDLLSREGIEKGSDQFHKELRRRFRPSDHALGAYVENEVWLNESAPQAGRRFDVC